jgi:uncharacterized protein with HEPN domain
MQRERNAYLWDIRNSIELIVRFTSRRTVADYRHDPMLRSAVERQLGIIGEATAQLLRRFPETGPLISYSDQIIAFRNMLIHGHSLVSDEIVWSVIHTDLPDLRNEDDALLTTEP